jgi:Tol biopolymer transport system component
MWQSASAQQAELIWLDRTGKKLGQLPAPASASNPKISWQGSRVAYTAQGLREIDYTEVSRGVVRKVAAADAALYHPLWSPDGNKIVYYSKGQILMRDTDTDGAPVEVAKGPKSSAAFLHDWSRDGRYITYAEFGAKGGLNLMALPMNGLKPSGDAFLVFHSTQRSLHTALSPDSQWVAFSTNEDNHYQVFVTPLADQTKTEGRGPRWQVSTEGGVDPKWSTDGKQIYFLNNGFKKLLAADFKPGNPPTFSTPRPVFDWSFAWSAGVRNSYTIDPSSGRILVVSPISQTYSPITVLVNWAGLLKKN